VVAAKAGGVMELVEHEINGFLVTPGNPQELAEVINSCIHEPHNTAIIAQNARISASLRFDVTTINQQIGKLLHFLAKNIQ
jgi:glycosyltransferase involved in cell wall biosynthesis